MSNLLEDALAELLPAALDLEHGEVARLLGRVRAQAVEGVGAGGGARLKGGPDRRVVGSDDVGKQSAEGEEANKCHVADSSLTLVVGSSGVIIPFFSWSWNNAFSAFRLLPIIALPLN